MENPARLLQRAALNRRQKAPDPSPEPAPEPPAPAGLSRPKHISHHASYTALMRSHDRVSTRHIAPRSGA